LALRCCSSRGQSSARSIGIATRGHAGALAAAASARPSTLVVAAAAMALPKASVALGEPLVPPPRKCLSAIIDDIDDEATVKKKKEKALAEHVARYPEDVGRTVEDFNWILHEIVRSFIPQR